MSTKRGLDEADSSAHPDRVQLRKRFKHASGSHDDNSYSSPNPYNNAKNSNHKARQGTMNWVKKRARTIERTFQRDRDTMPANKTEDLKRELDSHRRAIQDSQNKRQRQKMLKKYHMVRFFERKKAERLRKQLQKRLSQATDDEEIAAIKTDMHIAEIDKLYAVYFPYLERYISLYPVAKKGEVETSDAVADEKSAAELALHSERPPLWAAIEEAAAKGEEFLEMLRDRQSETASSPPVRTKRAKVPKSKDSAVEGVARTNPANRAERRQLARESAKTVAPKDSQMSESRHDTGKGDRNNEDHDEEKGGGFFDFGHSITS